MIQFNDENTHQNNNTIDYSDQEWETDSEGEEFFRLKLDATLKIKTAINKILKMSSRKFKKIDKKDIPAITEVEGLFNNEIFPQVSINGKHNGELKLSRIQIKDEFYNLALKPEVGSNLIFEIDKGELNLVGVSKEYYEAKTKVLGLTTHTKKNPSKKENPTQTLKQELPLKTKKIKSKRVRKKRLSIYKARTTEIIIKKKD